MPIEISEFQPTKEPLVLFGPSGQRIQTDQEYWIRLIPPTFREDRERSQYIKLQYTSSGVTNNANNETLHAIEIWLTFGGTNLEISVPITDENGDVVQVENDEGLIGPKMKTVKFPKTRSETTRQEFLGMLDMLPSYFVQSWRDIVISTVAPDWALPF